MQKLLESVLDEYRRVDGVQLWSEAQKSAARSVLRGVVVRAGCYPEFLQALDAPAGTDMGAIFQEEPERAFGGFIRF